MKHIAPQFDLPLTDFALVGQETPQDARHEPTPCKCNLCGAQTTIEAADTAEACEMAAAWIVEHPCKHQRDLFTD